MLYAIWERYHKLYLTGREELRNLIQYIEPYMRPPVYSDFEDILMEVSEEYVYLSSGNDFNKILIIDDGTEILASDEEEYKNIFQKNYHMEKF